MLVIELEAGLPPSKAMNENFLCMICANDARSKGWHLPLGALTEMITYDIWLQLKQSITSHSSDHRALFFLFVLVDQHML